MSLDLFGDEVSLGNRAFLMFGVPGEHQDLHTISQRGVDGFQDVRRRDEKDAREVEGEIEVVITKGRVLLRVEDLQERGRRIAPEVGPHLIDFIEHDDWIARLRPADALNDATGHGTDIGASMTADLRLIMHPAEGHPHEFSFQGRGNGVSERGLPHSRRANKTEDRALHVALELAHRQIFEDALLDLLEVVMVRIQHLPGPGQVHIVRGLTAPGEFQHPLQIGPDDPVFRRGRGDLFQAAQLPLGLLEHIVGQVGGLHFFA